MFKSRKRRLTDSEYHPSAKKRKKLQQEPLSSSPAKSIPTEESSPPPSSPGEPSSRLMVTASAPSSPLVGHPSEHLDVDVPAAEGKDLMDLDLDLRGDTVAAAINLDLDKTPTNRRIRPLLLRQTSSSSFLAAGPSDLSRSSAQLFALGDMEPDEEGPPDSPSVRSSRDQHRPLRIPPYQAPNTERELLPSSFAVSDRFESPQPVHIELPDPQSTPRRRQNHRVQNSGRVMSDGREALEAGIVSKQDRRRFQKTVAQDIWRNLTKKRPEGFGFKSEREFIDLLFSKGGGDGTTSANITRFCKSHGKYVADKIFDRASDQRTEYVVEKIESIVQKEAKALQEALTRSSRSKSGSNSAAVTEALERFSMDELSHRLRESAPRIWKLLSTAVDKKDEEITQRAA